MKYLLIISIIAIGVYFGSILFQKISSKINIVENSKQINMQNDELEIKFQKGELGKAVFSGGCFWCTEASYNNEYGVVSAVSGFFDGTNPTPPTYQNHGNYREGVLVYFNNASTSYKKLLVNYWHHIDPTQEGGQFADIGSSYKTAIYYFNEDQKRLAEESKKILEDSKKFGDKKVVVEIIDGRDKDFFPAEEYHQDYSEKNPVRYEYYKNGSGRGDFVKKYWKEDQTFDNFLAVVDGGLKKAKPFSAQKNFWLNFDTNKKKEALMKLSEIQYSVTQKDKTETPFQNEYDSNKERGIYVDIVSGEPLFSSTDKYDSKSGWPSFVKPISEGVLILRTDYWLVYPRTEVRSKIADSHLGHVFDDGPAERGGKRYCMNSASMKFISLPDMEKLGYGDFIKFVE